MKYLITSLKYAGVFFTTIIIIALSTLLIFYGSGYRYDFKNKKVFRTGLIYLLSFPSKADVVIDGKTYNKKTPTKIENLNPGNYNVKVQKPGFSSWEKTLGVKETLVTWAQYILLFPDKLEPKEEISSLSNFKISKNRKTAAVLTTSQKGTDVVIYDLLKGSLAKTIPIPGKNNKAWQIAEWSKDGKNILLRAYDEHTLIHSWQILRINSGEVIDASININKSVTNLRFHPKNSDELYFIDKNTLFSWTTSSSLIKIVAKDIINFELNEDQLYAVLSNELGNRLVRMGLDGNNPTEILPALPVGTGYKIFKTKYDNNDTIIIFVESLKTVIIAPKDGTSIKLARSAEDVSISPKGRFLLMRSGDDILVHDFEEESDYYYTLHKLKNYEWLFTDSHLLIDREDKFVVTDFDGTNEFILDKNTVNAIDSSIESKKIYYIKNTDQKRLGLFSLDLKESF